MISEETIQRAVELLKAATAPSRIILFGSYVRGDAREHSDLAFLVVLWLPSYFIFTSVDTWQLIINTITTIVTFLLVALLQNTQTRADAASQQKLNAIADALADLITNVPVQNGADMRAHARDLREAVGLEDRTSA